MFVVIEGCDGAGAGAQAEILREKLMEKGNILFLRYPDYNDPIGEMIHEFLHEKIALSKEIVFSLYAIDQLKDKEKIAEARKRGKVVLADRYFTSNIAYQCSQDFGVDKALKFAEILGIPKPDLVIFIRVSPETAIKRKMKEKNNVDIYEREMEIQKRVNEMYEKMAREKIFAKEWETVDGEKDIEEVAKDIEKIVFSRLK